MGAYGSPDLTGPIVENGKVNKNMIYCSYCGMRYNKNNKRCPQCGKKHAQHFYNKWWFWVIIFFIVCAILSSQNNNNTILVNEGTNSLVNKETYNYDTTIPEDEYKASCISIKYKDLARNPSDFVGKKVSYKGKVMQVQENGKNVVIMLEVTESKYGIWDDTIYIDYRRKSNTESRVLEDDIITVYGEVKGIKTYITVLGAQKSIPHIVAGYIDIN